MAFPQSFMDELTARNDIVDVVGSYVTLTSKGGSFWGCCPFHNEKTPSFSVSPDKRLFCCFGCGKKGVGSIYFIMEKEGLSYPDAVRFLARRQGMEVPETGENVVISVIDMANHTDNDAIIEAYERLLEQAVVYFSDRGIPVTLVSFCQWQGDEAAANRLLERVGERENVSTCFYRGDAAPVLEALARATYVIGSRFHSIILGLSFGKCVFPILYNCKTRHYLKDLRFSGKYADLEDLPKMTLEDVLYNYRNHIQTDCADHRRYAENQFRGLREYLKNREESRVENGIV